MNEVGRRGLQPHVRTKNHGKLNPPPRAYKSELTCFTRKIYISLLVHI